MIWVVWDMKIFLLFLLIITLAFTEAFMRISEGSGGAAFIPDYGHGWLYVFCMGIGDTNTGTFD